MHKLGLENTQNSMLVSMQLLQDECCGNLLVGNSVAVGAKLSDGLLRIRSVSWASPTPAAIITTELFFTYSCFYVIISVKKKHTHLQVELCKGYSKTTKEVLQGVVLQRLWPA